VSTNERSGECSIHGSWESYCYSCLTQARSGCVIEVLHLYDPSHDLNRIASLEAERDAALARAEKAEAERDTAHFHRIVRGETERDNALAELELSRAERDAAQAAVVRAASMLLTVECTASNALTERDAALAELNETRIALLAAHARACSAYAEELETTRNERDSAYLRGEERMRKVNDDERDAALAERDSLRTQLMAAKQALRYIADMGGVCKNPDDTDPEHCPVCYASHALLTSEVVT